MYDIDVNGTQAVLQAASEAGVKQVLVTSSATAYGAWPDNPEPIAEDWPVRGAARLLLRQRQGRGRPHLPALGRSSTRTA